MTVIVHDGVVHKACPCDAPVNATTTLAAKGVGAIKN